jgi:hypothetical protein
VADVQAGNPCRRGIPVCMYVCMYALCYVCIYVCIYVYMMYVCEIPADDMVLYVCIRVCVGIYACVMYVCLFIYRTHTHARARAQRRRLFAVNEE